MMKQAKINELKQAYNEFLKSWYDGRSTRNIRDIRANNLIAKFTKVDMFDEFFKLLPIQDKIIGRDSINYIVEKFNYIRKTNFKTNDIIYVNK